MTQTYVKLIGLLTLLCAFEVTSLQFTVAAEYLGSDNCQQCHGDYAKLWRDSDHAKAMQHADPEAVLGDFDNKTINFHSVDSRFFKKGKQYWVETLGADSKRHEYRIGYTFGYYPLQQYLIETDGGHLQAFDIAWDSRPAEQGGQRWFHLQPAEEITPAHPFFWANNFQNWNSRCADCHSTHIEKNYDAKTNRYATTWSELNVACEACHGPGSAHVTLARSGELTSTSTGFVPDLGDHSRFAFQSNGSIAVNQGAPSPQQVGLCGHCHSRRSIIGEIEPGKNYHDQFRLSLLNRGLYFADGQAEDEVFVMGSFLQSKMHAAGVTCTNCHDPHTTKLKIQGNGLCLQCHKAAEYQSTSHLQHKADSAGSQCVDCHMPERTYMQVDPRRDHSFSIPRPQLNQAIGAPNACQACHGNWSEQALLAHFEKRFGKEPLSSWAMVNHEAFQLNSLALLDIATIAQQANIPPIRRASLLAQGVNFPSRLTLETLQSMLHDPEPLIRVAAAEAAGFLSAQDRLAVLQTLITDESKVVRMTVANELADTLPSAPAATLPKLHALFAEYENSLRLSEDMPGTQINLGTYYHRQGDLASARKAYQQALIIDPTFVPAMINLADSYRASGDEVEAEKSLQRALVIAADSGAAQHALGLLYVRRQQLDRSLVHLKLATEQVDATPRFSYVYAVALDSVNNRNAGIEVLVQAEKRWPNQPQNLMLLINYLDQQNRTMELLTHLSSLSRIMPGDPGVRALVAKYTNQ